MEMNGGRQRVVIEGVNPEIDCGRYPVKRVVGEQVEVEADVFTDGHDAISCVVLQRPLAGSAAVGWQEVRMEFLNNDRWRGSFTVDSEGVHCYTVEGWVDRFKTWARDLQKRLDAGQDVTVDLQIGSALVSEAAGRAEGRDANRLRRAAEAMRDGTADAVREALAPDFAALMFQWLPRPFVTRYERDLRVTVDRVRARFGAWYETFPRSTSPEPGRHGTLKDIILRLPYIADMGFDVLYLPPIHPIGMAFRKGPNNNVQAQEGDLGSPWAIGGAEGGHKAIHPELGTLDDFRRLVERAKNLGLELAMDVAFQTSPDHPYVKEHPEWFRRRPDGTIQYAENPPKKYQDIYPFDFESDAWGELWQELKSIFEFWIEQGVKIFRVDNPHTKAFPFWEWCIAELKAAYPDVLFLAEAFTRPKVMKRLAKLGFTQSYTYFTWRNARWELVEYFTELTKSEMREYFRPNLWPNTPDILHEFLQVGGRPAFVIRYLLAATLAATYGIYGPAFELCEGRPVRHGSEEYLDSEKYQIRRWDLTASHSLQPLITKVNAIRRAEPALQSDWSLQFHRLDNEQLICYSKHVMPPETLSQATILGGAPGGNPAGGPSKPTPREIIVVVVNLDPRYKQSGWVELPLERFGLDETRPYQMHDLLTDQRYLWQGPHNYVELDPHRLPGHIFRVRRQQRSESDFDYYL